jgi:hypothetical protein
MHPGTPTQPINQLPQPTQAALRRFPLIGRPRPACPALAVRLAEVLDAVQAAQANADGIHDAAHALNKAALIASDAGMSDLARRLCWQHIDAYRDLGRPLTFIECRYMLEPVHNLARLQIRADHGDHALQLLQGMHHAITHRQPLILDDQPLPTDRLNGPHTDEQALRRWVWLQLVGDGVRALALADRWADAAAHATRHNGIGDHPMEGRQAAIIAHLVHGDRDRARALLERTVTAEPWEGQILPCLRAICTEPGDVETIKRHLGAAAARYVTRPASNLHASYRARLGLTIATLATTTRPPLRRRLLTRVANEAAASGNGYAARDVLTNTYADDTISEPSRTALTRLAIDCGLSNGDLPAATARRLTAAGDNTTTILARALRR